MNAFLDRTFGLRAHATSVRTELGAGVVTFLTMAYIVVVQPTFLTGKAFGTDTGMDFGAVLVATCLSAAFASAVMGLYARYPIAQAPGMGQNAFFVLSAVPAAVTLGVGVPWQIALGTVFWSAVLFLLLSVVGVRRWLLDAISPSMKHAIAVGIGLFIAFIGLQNARVVVASPGTLVRLTDKLVSPDLAVFFLGFLTTVVLDARRVPGTILWGMVAATVLALGLRYGLPADVAAQPLVAESLLFTQFQPATTVVSAPPSLMPTLLQLDVVNALRPTMLPFVLIFLFMLVFDTIGTLIGVCEQAGLMVDNKLPRARQALTSDALGALAGALLGTSTVTSYIESAAGVAHGGRTGLTALTVAVLFLLVPFFSPVVGMVASYPPLTAPALLFVGFLMMRGVTRIAWDDATEAVPAFLTLLAIPLTYSIADGIALGLIVYPLVKLLAGRVRELPWLMAVLAVVLLAYFLLVRR